MTETAQLTLADFLSARIAEDEEVAREAGGEFWYAGEVPPPSMRRKADEVTHWVIDSPTTLITYEVVNVEKAQHIARWDPERVLAECEAKRRLLESPYDFDSVLRFLALPYADHPNFRPEWRP